MKKKIVIASALAIATSSLLAIQSIASEDQAASQSDLISASVESLTSGEEEATIYGPREPEECKDGSKKMVCRCTNRISCTDSDCF